MVLCSVFRTFAAQKQKEVPYRMKRTLLTLLVTFMLLGFSHAQESMHVVLLGDSNTFIGGDSCNVARGWNKWFRDALQPATCRSYARSGATWTHTPKTVRDTEEYTEVLSDNNVIYNQVCRLQEAVAAGEQERPTLIIIMAGTNDAWFIDRRPQVFSNDLSSSLTLAGAVYYDCQLLREAFPEARIVLLTPMQATKTSLKRIRRTGDIIEACGTQMGLEVVRLDREGCVSRKQELRKKTYTTDGVHTNERGAQCIGQLVAEKILSKCKLDSELARLSTY